MDVEAITQFVDASTIDIKGVYANKESLMIQAQDESIWGVADRTMQGVGEKVWLRKIAKPDNCRGYRKIYHGYRVRLILTEEGNIFVSGNNKEIRGFNSHEYVGKDKFPDY